MRARCKWYDDDGAPIKSGCRRIGVNCDFVHPSEPQWASAPRHVQFGGGPGRQGSGRNSIGNVPIGAPSGPRGQRQDSGWNRNNNNGGGGWNGGQGSASSASTTGGGGGWSALPADSASNWGSGGGQGSTATASSDVTANAGGWGSPSGGSGGGWGDSTSGWGSNTSASWGRWNDSDSGSVQVPAAARGPPKNDVLQGVQTTDNASVNAGAWGTSDDAGGSWGVGHEDSSGPNTSTGAKDDGGGWNTSGASGWGLSGAKAAESSDSKRAAGENPFSFGDAPPPNGRSSGSRSRTASVSNASSSTARDEWKNQSLVPGSPARSRTSQDDKAIQGGFGSLLDTSTASRRVTYAFDDPTISPTELQYPEDNADPDEVTPDELGPSWTVVTKTIYRAVQYRQQLSEAQAMREKYKRLCGSRRLRSVSEVTWQPLQEAYDEHKKRVERATKRLDEVLDTLAKLPFGLGRTEDTDDDADLEALPLDDLKEYVREVQDWMGVMRDKMEDIRKLSAEHQAIDPASAQAIPEQLGKMETRVDGLSDYLAELQQTVPNAVRKAVDEAIARQQATLAESTEAAVAMAAREAAVAMDRRVNDVEQDIAGALSKLAELRGTLQTLRERDHKWRREGYQLQADQEELQLRLAKLEQAQKDTAAADTHAINDLKIAFKRLSIGQPPPPPQPTMEELCAQLSVALQPVCRQEVMMAVSTLKESALSHAKKQEEQLYSRMFEQLQPSLRVLAAVNEFMEAQRTRVVDAPSPAVTQLLQQAMS
ncbi:hypothetical protein DAEQUDRAFT_810839 [Daedalea quercina L-15889]|uniref:C3H1-type domain-containing protein n=1 Tax=Daedalea quercina L-15889 TaxID=1314783 RepID=A0A165QZ02_9APHY|nr:hypothetical protein DAEQUDRAFT_810839 [Daedalea quercina L-15889]